MSQLTPEFATSVLHAIALPLLTREHPLTCAVIAAIPADRGDYRPDAVAKTAIDLAWHIVAVENRFMSGVMAGAFDYGGGTRPDDVRTPADVLGWHAARFAQNLERLKAATAEQLMAPIDFRGMFTLPALGYLQIATNHSIHHRGQLSMYLRPMGAKVPSIYGESYDARVAREGGQPA